MIGVILNTRDALAVIDKRNGVLVDKLSQFYWAIKLK